MGSKDLVQAKRLAYQTAEEKYNDGLLISPNDSDYDQIFESGAVKGKEGGPETIYSIVSLYADSKHDDGTWADEIESLLENTFPEFM